MPPRSHPSISNCGERGVESVPTTKSAPRRVNDRGHGIGTEVQMQSDPTPQELELLRTLKRCEETGFNIAFDIALELKCTPRQAAGRLRAAMRKGWVESYRQPVEWVDRDTYYELTATGKEVLRDA